MWGLPMTTSAVGRVVLGSTLLAVAILCATLVAVPRTVHACSGESVPPGDESLRYVVGGWVRAISYEEQHPINELEPIAMTYTFEVDRVWRGDPPSTFTFVDSSSASGDTDDFRWFGVCGAMYEDPTDRYFLLAVPLNETEFGPFHLYGIGSGPDDPDIEWGLNFLSEELGVGPGGTGNAGLVGTDGAGGILPAVLAALAGLLVLTSRWITGRTSRAAARERSGN